MKNVLKIDHGKKTLIMDRTFAKNAEIVGSDEYMKLQMARKDYPKYKVKLRQIKRNPNKECYRGLTYEYMESYIREHANSISILAEYEEMRLISECHSIRYPAMKKWFLAKYPEVVEYGVPKEESAETNSNVAA